MECIGVGHALVSNGSAVDVILTFETSNASPEATAEIVMPGSPVRSLVLDPPVTDTGVESSLSPGRWPTRCSSCCSSVFFSERAALLNGGCGAS